MIVDYVDQHRDEFGVESICSALQMAPSTYYAAKKRKVAPSARAVRDAVMMPLLMGLWIANRKVYGAPTLPKIEGVVVGQDVALFSIELAYLSCFITGAWNDPPCSWPSPFAF